MTLGSLTTNQSWDALLKQLREELDKWGVTDYLLPYKGDSERLGQVSVTFVLRGQEKTFPCKKFSGLPKGPERNLCALKEAIRAVRLADQRDILDLLTSVAELAALNPYDPWRVLGAEKDDLVAAKTAYREKLKIYQPDVPGTGNRMMYDLVKQAAEDVGVG